MVIGAAILAAVLVLPVRAWLRQRSELASLRREQAALDVAINDQQAENDQLKTSEGVKDAARQELGLIDKGEKVIAVLPASVSEQMPVGWPYSVVGQILAARQASVIAASATTTPPVTAAAPDPAPAQAAAAPVATALAAPGAPDTSAPATSSA